jgi:FdhD protein
MQDATKNTLVTKYNGNTFLAMSDLLAVEEPLEIRLEYGPATARTIKNLSVTMRTPGNDADLVAGFLFTEGIIRNRTAISGITFPAENVVMAHLNPDLQIDLQQLDRHFYTTSSCGVCGKTSIEAVKTAVVCTTAPQKMAIDPEIIYGLPETLRRVQTAFDATGGIHAAAIFDPEGHLRALREDVGRHNALDKLIGHFLQRDQVPLDHHILLLSGRASFELIQKAAMAGIRLVCAVGAPSSLAVETAHEFGIDLIGFLRDGRFNRYKV